VNRCLIRHGLSRLRDILPKTEDVGETDAPKKTFKDYEPGFLHIDIKYLPKMPEESQHRYLFVAIDRATPVVDGGTEWKAIDSTPCHSLK